MLHVKRLREWGAIAALALLVIAFYAYWHRESLFYTIDQFHGEGTIRLNKGHWPYPDWYSVRFRSIPLDKPGSYQFRFRGVPPKEFTFHLEFPLSRDGLRDLYAQLRTHLSVALSDEAGTVLGSASSPLTDGWHLSERGFDAQFYHWNTYKLSLHSDRAYELHLIIKDVDPKTPRIEAVPLLESTRG